MKSFVIMTYYHLEHAIATALTLDEKPNLYASGDTVDFSEKMLERIRETGIFARVTAIYKRGAFRALNAEMQKTEGLPADEIDQIGDAIFVKYLEPYYAKKFKDADFSDDVFVYNDFTWNFWYVARHFEKITVVEDAYGSIPNQFKYQYKGDAHKLKEPFYGNYYPEPLFRSPHVIRVIGSRALEGAMQQTGGEIKDKFVVQDFYDLIEQNSAAYRNAILHIFQMNLAEIGDVGALIVGQRLFPAYCTETEEYLLHRKMVRDYAIPGKRTLLKPHPAGVVDLTPLGSKEVVVLSKHFPIEILEYCGVAVDRAVTFGSSSILSMAYADEKIVLYDNATGNAPKVSATIRELILGEKASVPLRVRLKLSKAKTFLRKVYQYLR
jgi:hypothetical protein